MVYAIFWDFLKFTITLLGVAGVEVNGLAHSGVSSITPRRCSKHVYACNSVHVGKTQPEIRVRILVLAPLQERVVWTGQTHSVLLCLTLPLRSASGVVTCGKLLDKTSLDRHWQDLFSSSSHEVPRSALCSWRGHPLTEAVPGRDGPGQEHAQGGQGRVVSHTAGRRGRPTCLWIAWKSLVPEKNRAWGGKARCCKDKLCIHHSLALQWFWEEKAVVRFIPTTSSNASRNTPFITPLESQAAWNYYLFFQARMTWEIHREYILVLNKGLQ